MKRILACLATLALTLSVGGAQAEPLDSLSDPVGDLIAQVLQKAGPVLDFFHLKATLYHAGHGMSSLDSIGCKVVAMRTAAVDGVSVPRHTLLFIKETVGLRMPDGRLHDGYWYASDVGGAIHTGRIDLFTGQGAASMTPLMPLNLATLTVAKVGQFKGCPQG
jgi:3D (Asp-Asp-Asp) domain-containing protein